MRRTGCGIRYETCQGRVHPVTTFNLTTKDYYASYGDPEILKGVSITFCSGEIVALIGANGSGKSTLLRGLMGLVPVRRGEVSLNGKNVIRYGPPEMAEMGVAYLPQKRDTFVEMSVMENLVVGGISLPLVQRSRNIDETVEKIPQLKSILKRKVGELSIGTKRVVALARALVPKPSALLLDEPLAGLSPKLNDEILLLIKAIRDDGQAILIVEHQIRNVLKHCDRVYGLRSGEILFDGKPSELISSDDTLNQIMKY